MFCNVAEGSLDSIRAHPDVVRWFAPLKAKMLAEQAKQMQEEK
jgi:hypothetical protein